MGYDSVILTDQSQGNGKSTYPEILDLRVHVHDTYSKHIHQAARFLTDVNGSRCEVDCLAECCLSCKNSIQGMHASCKTVLRITYENVILKLVQKTN